MLTIESAPLGWIETNAFLLRSGGDNILVDAPDGSLDWIGNLLGSEVMPTAIWLTHGHWDHMADAWRFAAKGVPVYAHEGDRVLLEQPELQLTFAPPGLEVRPVTVNRWLRPGEILKCGDAEAEVLHVPGHAPGNVAFHFADQAVALVGDVIFHGGVGRTDLPGGNPALLVRSIREQIYTLSPETRLLSGHGPETTVEREMDHNPFVRPTG